MRSFCDSCAVSRPSRQAVLLAALFAASVVSAAEPPAPLTRLHAHNDYRHPRPLLDALDHGFCSVEADIFLVDGQLLVAHDLPETTPERTLQKLYLDPLRERVRQNGGRVHANGPEFTLLIDLKQDWPALYPSLRSTLTNYADILTTFRGDRKQTNAVLVILTGKRDPAMFDGETVRYAALDGGLGDLEANPPASLVPWISASWTKRFRWRGAGAIPDAELSDLKGIVRRAHEQGRRVRFWAAPDTPNFWQVMHVTGVDLINTDDLAGARNFYQVKNTMP